MKFFLFCIYYHIRRTRYCTAAYNSLILVSGSEYESSAYHHHYGRGDYGGTSSRHGRRRSTDGDGDLYTRRPRSAGTRTRSRSPPAVRQLYENIEENERLRRELDEERRRLEEAECLSSRPTFSPAESRPSLPHDRAGRVGTGGGRGPREEAGESGGGSDAAASSLGATAETLKPGNFLLATWDCKTLGANAQGQGTIVQIGTFLPHGVSVSSAIYPAEECSDEELKESGHFSQVRGRWHYRRGYQWTPTVTTTRALEDLLSFLEKGCDSVRPRYDGVVLLSHIQESIPGLLKAVRKQSLYDRFRRTVKGMGDLCSFLAQCHMKRFVALGTGHKMDLGLHAVSGVILGERIGSSASCERKAQTVYDILERLLEAKPGYANFFSRFLHPLESRVIHRLASFRTVREKVDACLPLRIFIAQELAAQQVELIVEGVYAPSQEDEDKYLPQPEQVALAVCRLLVTSELDFEHLLKVYRENGLPDLELTLRTTFLGKMAGQSRAVVDQTIRATRLVVAFFRQHGHKTFETMMREASEEAERTQRARDRSGQAKQQEYQHTPADPDLRQTEFKKMFESFQPAAQYFRRRLLKKGSNPSPLRSSEDVKVLVDMLINSLIQAQMDHDRLASVYLKDKERYKHRNNLRNYLGLALGDAYRHCGPPELNVNQFIDLIIDYCGNHVFAKQQQSPLDPGSHSQLLSAEALESGRVALDMAIHESTRAFSLLSEFQTRLLSLTAVKLSLVKRLEPTVAICGGTPEQVEQIGEHVQKLVALLGFHHVALRRLYQTSEEALAGELFGALRRRPDLLPPGVGNETIVNCIVEYFKEYQQAISNS